MATLALDNRSLCRTLVDVCNDLNAQVKNLSQDKFSLISDDPEVCHQSVKITSADLQKYLQAISGTEEDLERIYRQFKEDRLIDALADISDDVDLSKLTLPASPPRPKGFELDDILTIAKTRRTIFLYLDKVHAQIYHHAHHTPEATKYCMNRLQDKFRAVYGIELKMPFVGVQTVTTNGMKTGKFKGDRHPSIVSGAIPDVMPAELFIGVKENDSRTITIRESDERVMRGAAIAGADQQIQIKMIFRQIAPSDYLNFQGDWNRIPFEKAFEQVTNRAATDNPTLFDPPVSHETQVAMIQKVHDEHVQKISEKKI